MLIILNKTPVSHPLSIHHGVAAFFPVGCFFLVELIDLWPVYCFTATNLAPVYSSTSGGRKIVFYIISSQMDS